MSISLCSGCRLIKLPVLLACFWWKESSRRVIIKCSGLPKTCHSLVVCTSWPITLTSANIWASAWEWTWIASDLCVQHWRKVNDLLRTVIPYWHLQWISALFSISMLKHTASLSDESFGEILCENLLLPSFLLAYAWLHLLSYFNKSVDISLWSAILHPASYSPGCYTFFFLVIHPMFPRGISLRWGTNSMCYLASQSEAK